MVKSTDSESGHSETINLLNGPGDSIFRRVILEREAGPTEISREGGKARKEAREKSEGRRWWVMHKSANRCDFIETYQTEGEI